MCKVKGYSFLLSTFVTSFHAKDTLKLIINNLSSQLLMFIIIYCKSLRDWLGLFLITSKTPFIANPLTNWSISVCVHKMRWCKQMHLINSSLSSKVTMGFVYPALNLSGVLKDASCLNLSRSPIASSSSNVVFTFPLGRSLTDTETESSLLYTM